MKYMALFCSRSSHNCFPKQRVCILTVALLLAVAIVYFGSFYRSVLSLCHYNYFREGSTKFSSEGDGQWYNFSTTDGMRLFVYSAFYDDRASILSDPVIRIVAISDKIKDENTVPNLYCVLHYTSRVNDILRMKEPPKPIGYGWHINQQQAKEYILTCPSAAKGVIPHSICIVAKKSDPCRSPRPMPLTIPEKPKKRRDVGVCTQVAYGTIDPYRIIEWMEMQRILGVSQVGIYSLGLSEKSLDVFRHYSEDGFVDLRKTKPIDTDEKHYLIQGSPVINDCIYRHMHKFHRIAVIDLDEFILPRKQENIPDLIAYLDKIYPEKVNYVFRNNYFFLDIPPDAEMTPSLTFLRFRKKVEVSPHGYSVKSIINPQACTNMHNHHCWGVTANYTKYTTSQSVDPDIALNQHYKKCHISRNECEQMMKNVTQDDTMLRFTEILVQRVREKVKIIMGENI